MRQQVTGRSPGNPEPFPSGCRERQLKKVQVTPVELLQALKAMRRQQKPNVHLECLSPRPHHLLKIDASFAWEAVRLHFLMFL